MNRHTISIRTLSILFKKAILGALSLGLLFTGIFACVGGGSGGPGGPGAPGGGGISPVGGLGSGGMGAPPLAIPAPEALNMTVIAVASEGAGSANIAIAPGAGRPDSNLVVTNLGDIARFQPLKRWILPSAYAVGETQTFPIGPNGATVPPNFTFPAVVNDWLEFKQCLKVNPGICSAAFRVEIVNGTSPPAVPKASIKSMSVGSDGIYTNESSSSKKWRWMDLFISNVYAEETLLVRPIEGLVLPRNNSSLIPFAIQNQAALSSPAYPAALCNTAPYQFLNYSAESDGEKFCSISFTPTSAQQSNNPESAPASGRTEVIRIPDCDAGEGLVYAKDKEGAPHLWVTSRNKIFEVNRNEKRILSQRSYPNGARISAVQYINGHLFVTLDPGAANVPRVWLDHDCYWGVTHLTDAVQITGSSSQQNSFAFSVRHPKEYCVWYGNSDQEWYINQFAKIPNSCQANSLDAVEITRNGRKWINGTHWSCGLNYTVLSSTDKKLVNIWHRHHDLVPSACASNSVTSMTIPYATNPVDIAFNGSDTLAVLDLGEGGARKLISFRVQPNAQWPEKMELLYMSSVDLPDSTATLLDYSPTSHSFATNDFAPESQVEGLGSLRLIGSTTLQREIGAVRVPNPNVIRALEDKPLLRPDSIYQIYREPD